MKRSQLAISLRCLLLTALMSLAAGGILTWGAPPPDKEPGVLLTTMQAELGRAKTSLAKSNPAPYFISYEVYDEHTMTVAGTYGTIVSSGWEITGGQM